MKKIKVTGRQYFDSYPDGTFDYKEFDNLEEAKKYIEENKQKEGNVVGRYKVVRRYHITEGE